MAVKDDPTAPTRRYALNFCSTCGSRFDCEECAEPAVDPSKLAVPESEMRDVEPTAPTRTEAEHVAGCRYEKEFPALDPEDCPRCAPTRTEAEGVYPSIRETVVNRTDPPWTKGTAVDHIPCLQAMAAIRVRTEAERAVLDAARDWFALWNPLGPEEDSAHYALYRAELARRGLK